jgi:glucose/arabinose dehydrogenase
MDQRSGIALAAIIVVAFWSSPSRAGAQEGARTVIDGADFVTGIAFLSDGTMLFNERDGVVRRSDTGGVETIAEIPTVVQGETGLLGISVAPDERSFYVFATELGGESNTVWRADLDGGDPERVIEGMSASFYHNGGGLAFDEDGMLLVSNGEEHDGGLSQDPAAFGGKVYRFTPEGDVPSDNPFGDTPAFAIGLRNPYGLAVDPQTGTPWVTENGPSSYDEVNRILPGGNYGWPNISGPSSENAPADLEGDYQDPAVAYEDIIVPTGIAFAGDDATDEFAGDLFFASYGEGAIHALRLNDARDEVESDEIVHQEGEPVIALAWGPGGLYFSTPEAIKLLPIASEEEEEGSPAAAAGAPSREAEPSPSPTRDGERSGIGTLLAIAIPVLLLLAFLATRNRIDRASRDVDTPPHD